MTQESNTQVSPLSSRLSRLRDMVDSDRLAPLFLEVLVVALAVCLAVGSATLTLERLYLTPR